VRITGTDQNREGKRMQEYFTEGTGALWNDFTDHEQAEPGMPGISLIQPGEISILESLEDNPQLLSRALMVKAVFQGTIVGHALYSPRT